MIARLIVGQKMFWNAINLKTRVKISCKRHRNSVVKANKHSCFVHVCAESIISKRIRFLFQSVRVVFFFCFVFLHLFLFLFFFL